MHYTKHTLKNGLRYVLVPRNDTQAFTLLVLFKVGSRYETKGLYGAAHYIEHLMFKGTKKQNGSRFLMQTIMISEIQPSVSHLPLYLILYSIQ